MTTLDTLGIGVVFFSVSRCSSLLCTGCSYYFQPLGFSTSSIVPQTMGQNEFVGQGHTYYAFSFWICLVVLHPKFHQVIVLEVTDLASALMTQVVHEEAVAWLN